MATADQIARSSKVILDVVVDGRRARLEKGTVAYFLWRFFGSQCPFVMELTGLLTWSKTNQVTFDRQVKNLHNTTAFVAYASWVLGHYLNSSVVGSTTAKISAPGSRTPVSQAPLFQELSWENYHGIDHLPPELSTLLHQQDELHRDSGMDTPGNHEARL